MRANAIVFGWNRSVPGREQESGRHFEEFVGYLTGLQKSGAIGSFETVFLDPHGGDLNGFFLIRGTPDQMDALAASTDWAVHITRGNLHLMNAGVIRAATGAVVAERMALWNKLTPA
ncbi:MAG TPA: hypothetical protein VLL51_05235 [Gemmatimonadales bacterium]|nr:hypothetical protein [Gemmatimonadales bacterium]